MSFNKIFGIGLSKTGTTSLNVALNMLGIPSKHNPAQAYYKEKKEGLPYFSTIPEYRGFTDFPCNLIYRELDRLYPGSKFILTIRDPDAWLYSRRCHYREKLRNGQDLKWDVKESSKRWFAEHNGEVMSYFRDRPDDLLIMDITAGAGWEELCPFVGVPVSEKPFPHLLEGYGHGETG